MYNSKLKQISLDNVYSHSGIAKKLVDPFTIVVSLASMGPFNSTVSFASCGPFSPTCIWGVSLSHGLVCASSGKDEQKASHKNDCNGET